MAGYSGRKAATGTIGLGLIGVILGFGSLFFAAAGCLATWNAFRGLSTDSDEDEQEDDSRKNFPGPEG